MKVFTNTERTRKGEESYVTLKTHCRKIRKLDAEKYDSVYVDITTERNRKLTIGTVYKLPKLQAADDTALYEEINFTIQNKEAIIIGDFNCPNVEWTLMHE